MDKLTKFARLLQAQQIKRLRKDKFNCPANMLECKVTIKPGKKYTKVDIGGSGRYMIDREGNIYGIKAYGVIHKGHSYGTLDTINQYYWGGYTAIKITAKITDEKTELIKKINTVYIHQNQDLTKFTMEQLEKHLNLIIKEREGK